MIRRTMSAYGTLPFAVPEQSDVDPIRILLLADDAVDLRQALEDVLGDLKSRFAVEHVDTLAAALEVLRAGSVDVGLIDLSLPDVEGVSPLTRILESAPGLSTIVVTDPGNIGSTLEAVEAGAQEFVIRDSLRGNLLRRGLFLALSRLEMLVARDQQATMLKESEERFRSAFDDAAIGMVLVSSEGWLLRVNEAALGILGYLREEAQSANWESFFHPDELKQARANLGRLLVGEISSFCSERRLRHRIGHFVSVRINSAVARTPDGRVAHIIAQLEDITDQRYAEWMLRQSEKRYRQLFERNLAAVVRTTADGHIVDCNRAFVRMLGCDSVAEVRGLGAQEIYADPTERAAIFSTLKNEGEIRNWEISLRSRDGRKVLVMANASRVKADGDEIEATLVDVTRQRHLEKQLRQAQKMEAIGRLAGGVAHDFNNLLTAINGYADLGLATLGSDDDLYMEMSNIRAAGERAVELTKQLLTFSRQQEHEPQAVDLNQVVRDIEALLQLLISEDIEIVVSVDDRPLWVWADRGEIEQVLMNLVVNASDAMPDGGKLCVETEPLDVDESVRERHQQAALGAYAQLTVADTGDGMDEETVAQAFEPFFTTKEPGEGTGLGLSTVYGIVERSDGFIAVYTQPGIGTTIKVCLRLVEETEEPSSVQAEVGLEGGAETILLVEDDRRIRCFTHQALEARGYRVHSESESSSALQLVRESDDQIDLLLTDLIMPGMNGVELARQVVEMRPATKVLMVSGYAKGSILEESGAAGESRPMAYMSKPYNMQTLTSKIREVLDER